MKTRYIAVIAILALAVCCFGVIVADNDDGAFTPGSTYQPTAAAMGANHMKVIAYDDGALLVDTNAMTNLGNYVQFVVGLKPYDGETPKDELKVGPISMQNGRVWIDAATTNGGASAIDLLRDGEKLDVILYPYLHETEGKDTVTITFTDDVATVVIYSNFNALLGDDSKYTPDEVNNNVKTPDFGGAWKRNVVHDLNIRDAGSHTGGVITSYPNPPEYKLKGLSETYLGNSKIVVQPNAAITVEDLICEMFDSGVAAPINGSNKIELFAIWEKVTYQMLVADASVYTALDPKTVDSASYKNTDVPVLISTQKAKANLTERVTADDFGLLRIEQTAAGNYTYTLGNFQKIASIDSSGVITWEDATVNTDYEYLMIVNGVYKIIPHADIRFTISAENTDPSTQNAYAFAVDEITNAGTSENPTGNVQLSLDLFDYKAGTGSSPESISLNGTYYRAMAYGVDSSEVRVYGNIDILTITDAAAKDATSNTWTAKINNVMLRDTDDVTSGFQNTNLVNGELKLNQDDQVYDLILDLYDYHIYAAQGVWTNYMGTGSATEITTPWALYQAD